MDVFEPIFPKCSRSRVLHPRKFPFCCLPEMQEFQPLLNKSSMNRNHSRGLGPVLPQCVHQYTHGPQWHCCEVPLAPQGRTWWDCTGGASGTGKPQHLQLTRSAVQVSLEPRNALAQASPRAGAWQPGSALSLDCFKAQVMPLTCVA